MAKPLYKPGMDNKPAGRYREVALAAARSSGGAAASTERRHILVERPASVTAEAAWPR